MTISRMTTPTRLVLAHLRAANGPVYGRQITSATGIQSGTLYPILRRLEAAGLIEGRDEDRSEFTGQGRPPRRYYQLTSETPATRRPTVITPPIGTTVHYRAENATLGRRDTAPGRCQAAIVTHHHDGEEAISLTVFGDTGPQHHPHTYHDPAHTWEDFTPQTWHHIH